MPFNHDLIHFEPVLESLTRLKKAQRAIPQISQAEIDQRNPPDATGPFPAVMFVEIFVFAALRFQDHFYGIATPVLASNVGYFRAGIKKHRASGFPHPVAEIRIFELVKQALIESSQSLQKSGAQQETTTRLKTHRPFRGSVPPGISIRHKRVGDPAKPSKVQCSDQVTKDRGPRLSGSLESAIRVERATSECAGLRMPVCIRHQLLQGPIVNDSIRVKDEHIFTLGHTEARVVSRSESNVGAVRHDARSGKVFPNIGQRTIGGTVVRYNDLKIDSFGFGVNRLKAGGNVLQIVPADYDDG